MNNQKQMWDSEHSKGGVNHDTGVITEFGQEVLELLLPSSKILEIGCGVGIDSVAFANAGHNVVATDFSVVAITKNVKKFENVNNLAFEVLDISDPTDFNDNEFDVVYARLSLHYFTESVTKKIFKEIHRILKSNGRLYFLCKSVKDPLYGKGLEIEKDMYELDGHVRHFFSEEFTKSLLQNYFVIDKFESGIEKFYGSDSAYIKVFARSVKK